MTTNQAVRDRLHRLISEHHLNRSDLSRKSGVPRSTINDMIDGNIVNIRIKNLTKIAKCFDMTLREFFDDPMFDNIIES